MKFALSSSCRSWRPSIERYHTNEFINVSSDILSKYIKGEFNSKTDFKHVFSVESILESCYTNDKSTMMLHDRTRATVSTEENSKPQSSAVSFAAGTKDPAVSPSSSPKTASTISTNSSDSFDVMDVLDKTGQLIEKVLANITPSAVPVLKPPTS